PARRHQAVSQGHALPDGEMRRRASRIRAGAAWPVDRTAPQGVGVREAAARKAESEADLRPLRAPVPQPVRAGDQGARRNGRSAARGPREQAGQGDRAANPRRHPACGTRTVNRRALFQVITTLDLTGLVRPHLVEMTKREDNPNSAEFRLQPLERGYGYTLGNSLRRLLLSS